MTEEDLNTLSAADVESFAESMRQIRTERLSESDWSMLSDNGLSEEQRAAWITYRQALRDLSSHADWPLIEDADLPTSPNGMPFGGPAALPSTPPLPDIVFPSNPAPTPTLDQEVVTSVFSNHYSNITVHEMNPSWSQRGSLYEELLQYEGEPYTLMRIDNLNWQGCNIADFGQAAIVGVDVSQHTALHMNFWLPEASGFRIGVVSHGDSHDDFVQRMITIYGEEGWNAVNIALTDFPTVDFSNLTQIIWDNVLSDNTTGVENFWFDNLYFNNEAEAAVTQPT